MLKASKMIPGIVYAELPAFAINVKCSPERVEVILQGKSQTNIVALSDKYTYTEHICQTTNYTEEEAHAIVTMPTSAWEMHNHKTHYPDFTSKYDKFNDTFESYYQDAITSLISLLCRDGISPQKNYLILKREIKTNANEN